jgi:hypothetical protein
MPEIQKNDGCMIELFDSKEISGRLISVMTNQLSILLIRPPFNESWLPLERFGVTLE